jgi:hypothetical protein
VSGVEVVRGSHPFFWGGLMLVDSGDAPQTPQEGPKVEQPALKAPAAPKAKMQNLGNPEKPEAETQ